MPPLSYAYSMNALQIIKAYGGSGMLKDVLIDRKYMCPCGRLLASGAKCDRSHS